jgi:hypothetical protein
MTGLSVPALPQERERVGHPEAVAQEPHLLRLVTGGVAVPEGQPQKHPVAGVADQVVKLFEQDFKE